MRLLVTGGSGFLGSNILRVAGERHGAETLAAVGGWRPDGPVGFRWAPLDVRDRDAVVALVRDFRPDAILHTAILADWSLMHADRRLAWDGYVGATRNLTDAANEVAAKMVLVSTDWVFDGTQAGAAEDTPPNPVNLYGVLKVVCETVVAERADDGAVARVAGVNGVHWLRPDRPSPQNAGFGSFATAVVEALAAGKPFPVWAGDVNLLATPSLASDCAEMLVRIVERDARGIFHCCGAETVSRTDLAAAVAEAFELDASLLRTGPPELGDLAGVRFPRDTSLSASRTADELGHRPLAVQPMLAALRAQLETGAI